MMTREELLAANLNAEAVKAALDQVEKRLTDILENKNALDDKVSQLFVAYVTLAAALIGVSGLVNVETSKWPFLAGGLVLIGAAIPLIFALYSRRFPAQGSGPEMWLQPSIIDGDADTIAKMQALIVLFHHEGIQLGEASNLTKALLFRAAIIIGFIAPLAIWLVAAMNAKP